MSGLGTGLYAYVRVDCGPCVQPFGPSAAPGTTQAMSFVLLLAAFIVIMSAYVRSKGEVPWRGVQVILIVAVGMGVLSVLALRFANRFQLRWVRV